MDTDTRMFIEIFRLILTIRNGYTTLLITLIGSSYCPAALLIIRQQNADTTQPNVSPDTEPAETSVSPRSSPLGTFRAETSPAGEEGGETEATPDNLLSHR